METWNKTIEKEKQERQELEKVFSGIGKKFQEMSLH